MLQKEKKTLSALSSSAPVQFPPQLPTILYCFLLRGTLQMFSDSGASSEKKITAKRNRRYRIGFQ